MIREAVPADVPAVAALELLSFPDDAWTPDYLTLAVDGGLPTVSLLVADSEDGAVAGHAILSIVFEVAELQRIAVHPAYRRHGLGSDLLVEVVGRSAAAGADRLLLEVREENAAALALYAAAGFTEIDRRPRYYRDGATGVVLQLDLGKCT
ncbi:ribosomal protein S18-alanine N-acetyltransferase [Nocardioides sp.]|uniref:ribosomal protein S18-alanine N-acetyltransferase n=1 Tax=Nocardioides sp. TaxID=35761 RepID=UPI0039E3739F